MNYLIQNTNQKKKKESKKKCNQVILALLLELRLWLIADRDKIEGTLRIKNLPPIYEYKPSAFFLTQLSCNKLAASSACNRDHQGYFKHTLQEGHLIGLNEIIDEVEEIMLPEYFFKYQALQGWIKDQYNRLPN